MDNNAKTYCPKCNHRFYGADGRCPACGCVLLGTTPPRDTLVPIYNTSGDCWKRRSGKSEPWNKGHGRTGR